MVKMNYISAGMAVSYSRLISYLTIGSLWLPSNKPLLLVDYSVYMTPWHAVYTSWSGASRESISAFGVKRLLLPHSMYWQEARQKSPSFLAHAAKSV